MDAKDAIFPRTIVSVARAYSDNPKTIGEIILAVCGLWKGKALNDAQKFAIAVIEDECNARLAQRQRATERKRNQRKGAK